MSQWVESFKIHIFKGFNILKRRRFVLEHFLFFSYFSAKKGSNLQDYLKIYQNMRYCIEVKWFLSKVVQIFHYYSFEEIKIQQLV
jgi:hypothetical protein